jgi:hypothetical protein
MNSDYSNLSGDISGTVTPTSSITTHPNFVSEVGRDFRLGGNSPCLDAGNNTYCTEAFDIRGSSFARKLNKSNGTLAGTIDMGAYEYKHATDPITGCTNPTSGGAIARNQTGCTSIDPTELTDSVSPTGYYGTLEYKWQKSTTSASSGFADISGATASTYDPGAITINTWFKRFARVACMSTWIGAGESNVVAITVYSTLTAGSISASQSICYNITPNQMTGTAPTGGKTPYSYQWQSSSDNVNFSNISGSTGLTYAPGALTATTYYRLLQTSDYCGTVSTNVVTKTVYGEFVVGTAGSDQSICQNSSPVILTATAPSGGNLPYSYLWQSSPDNTTFSDISGQTATTYQPGAMTISTWYRQKQVSSGGCGTLYTNSVHIEVEPTPVSGSLTKSPDLTTVCEGTDVSASATSGSGGNGTDVLEYRTETTSGWSSWIAYTSGNSINTTGKINVEIRTYRDADHCSTGSTITKSWAVSAGTIGGTLSGGQNVCSGSNSTVLTLTGFTGTIQSWKQSTDGTSWTVISGASTSTYTAIDVDTNTWYKVIVQSGVCPSDSSNTTQITVSGFSISGYVKYENNPKTPLDGLKVTLKKDGSPVGSPVVTNSTGYYSFTGVTNGTYSLEIASAHTSGQWQTWAGVNMTDALLVNNHINGINLLPTTPPVIQITASVKLPHPAIQTNDYTAIRLAAKSGWGYFDIPKWVFSGLTASEGLTGIVMNCSNITRDIRGLCAGDVNGTYVPLTGNKAAGIDPMGSLRLNQLGEIPMTDELFFPVTAGADMVIGALSLNLNFNPDQLIINRITYTSEPDEASYFTAENGLLSIGYLPKNPSHVKKDQAVLLIHATRVRNADKQVTVSTPECRFDLSGIVASELADPDGNIIGDALLMMPVASAKGSFMDARAISVYPNPAGSEVVVGLSVEKDGWVDYEILSITGRMILKTGEMAGPGYNETRWKLDDLPNGVYLVRVTTTAEQIIKKLIVNH